MPKPIRYFVLRKKATTYYLSDHKFSEDGLDLRDHAMHFSAALRSKLRAADGFVWVRVVAPSPALPASEPA